LAALALSVRALAQRFIVCAWNYRTSRLFNYLPRSWSRFQRDEFATADLKPQDFQGEGYFTYTEASAFFGWYPTKQILGTVSFCRDQEARDYERERSGAAGAASFASSVRAQEGLA